MSESNYQLIITIVNSGYSDEVMQAATKCGARGGTVINGRGTARQEAEKAFNIVIHPDKEIIFILVAASLTNDILKAIYETVNLNSDGQGISFVCPVDNVVGLTKISAEDFVKKANEIKKQENLNSELKAELDNEKEEAHIITDAEASEYK